MGFVGGDEADGLIRRDLGQQLGQHGAVANPAAGDLDCPRLHGVGLDPKVDLAPLARPGGAVLAGGPLALSGGLDAGAVDQQVQGTGARTARDLDGQPARAPAERGSKSGTGQSRRASFRRLATSPVVCRSASPNRAFNVRQVRIAASEKVAGRPRRPRDAPSHSVSGSNQTSSDPRCLRAAP
jgi:hypothetical protein